ncbi:SLC25A45 family protein [Megaselia abdita]
MLFPLLTTGGINSILFGVYGNHLRQLQRTCHSDLQRKQLEDNHIFAAGSLAGFVQSFIACPFEIVKIRLQTHHYYNKYLIGQRRTFYGTFAKILRNDGVIGLYRGLVPMMFRDVLPYGIYMLVYKKAIQFLENDDFIRKCRRHYRTKDSDPVDMVVTTLAGAFAGILSWVCVIPFDTVKTLMQAERTVKYISIRQCVTVNVKDYGWRCLFRGGYMLVIRAIPVNAATFLGYEYGLSWCQDYSSDRMYSKF